jgi:hypothetical protein
MGSLKSRMMFSYCGFFHNLVHAFSSKFWLFFCIFLVHQLCTLSWQSTFTAEAIEDGFCVFKLSIVGMGKQWNI